MNKVKYKQLSEACKYINTKIAIEKITLDNYISTENMMPEKGGVAVAAKLPDSNSVSHYNEKDILTSNIRPYFKKIWFATNSGGCSNDVLIIRANKGNDSRFLYYALSDNNFFNYATVTSKGTKMPRCSKNAVMKYLIPDITIENQKRIADVLAQYDELIYSNNKKIDILLNIAEQIYKEWFVRLRFPNYQSTHLECGIPEGWTIMRIMDFGCVETGKTPPTVNPENYGGDIMFIKTPDMHGQTFVVETGEYLTEIGHSTQPKKLLPAKSISVSCIGTGGIVAINSEPAHTNQQINSIVLNDIKYLEWLYFTAKALKPTIEMFGATGATMTNLSKGKFEKIKVICPSKELVYKYNQITSPMLEDIKELQKQNLNLIKQRDLLLPRLMNGKLKTQ